MILERSLNTTKSLLESYQSQEVERKQQLTAVREQYQQLELSSSVRVQELETLLEQQQQQLMQIVLTTNPATRTIGRQETTNVLSGRS
jgi:uncharacterized protein VirK/YbjX